jgi:hypothetical protein
MPSWPRTRLPRPRVAVAEPGPGVGPCNQGPEPRAPPSQGSM